MTVSKRFLCRNCNERTWHVHISDRRVGVSGGFLFKRYRKLPVYACDICQCELILDEAGDVHLPSEFPVIA